MKKSTLWSIIAAGVCLSWVGQAAQAAGDAEEGKKKFFTCGGCHSSEGYSNAFPTYPVPRIGGQHSAYLLAALKAYQDGNRKHGSMEGNANGWSERDLQDLAAYISIKKLSTESNVVSGNPEAGKAKAATCAGCHGEDGNSQDAANPRLAGQYEGYLVKVMKDYKKGIRKNPIMNGMVESLSEQEIKDIAAFYANQKRGLTTVLD